MEKYKDATSTTSDLQKEIAVLNKKIHDLQAEFTKTYNNLERVFLMTPEHIYWKNKEGVYQACNDQQAKTLGYQSGKDIVGKTDYDLPWKAKGDFLRDIDKKVMETGEEYMVEEPLPLPDGTEALFLSKKTPFYDTEGNIIGLIGISFNITQNKQIEKLKQEKYISEGIIRQLKTMAGSLAHELRTPLTGIKLGLQSMKFFFKRAIKSQQQLSTDDKKQKTSPPSINDFNQQILSVEKLEQRIDVSNELISLQLNNMTTESIDTSNFTLCNIQDCVNEAINTFPFSGQKQSKLVNIDLKFNFTCISHPLLIKHVLWNLLNNALHFIQEESKGEVFITVSQTQQCNVLRVKDTAKGMPPSIAKHVFEQFYSKRNGGSGLGLNFCKLVMEAMGGSITCEAEENEYAEFSLSFPKITDKQSSSIVDKN